MKSSLSFLAITTITGVWLVGACAKAQDAPEALAGGSSGAATGGSSAGGSAGTSPVGFGGVSGSSLGGGAGVGNPFGGASGAAGADDGGAAGVSAGGTAGAAGSAGGGAGGTVATCVTIDDCVQVAGECVACVEMGAALQCVNQGPSECGDGAKDACEVCDGTDLGMITSCTELGLPGDYSGGVPGCNDSCDGFDVESCSVCGNDTAEDGEQCDGSDVPPQNCEDIGLPPPETGPDNYLDCLASCEFDTLPCPKCQPNVSPANCLRDATTDCMGAACTGKQCGASETCNIDCGGDGCSNASCNSNSTCNTHCGGFASCEFECLSGAECNFDCSEYDLTCETTCRDGATCNTSCGQRASATSESECAFDCESGSSCNVDASVFNSFPTGTARCADGDTCSYTCGQADCSGLSVICEAGATCNISCTAHDAVCFDADCQAGATCTVSCGAAASECACGGAGDCTCTGSTCP